MFVTVKMVCGRKETPKTVKPYTNRLSQMYWLREVFGNRDSDYSKGSSTVKGTQQC